MIREASVTSGTEFLTHPAVISHSREEKVSFLRGKGLTGEEIEEAFRRVEATTQQPPQQQPQQRGVQPQQQQVAYAPAPMPMHSEEPTWSFVSNVLAPASLAVSAGASLLYFYKTYVLHEGKESFPWEGGGLQPPPLLQDALSPNPTSAPVASTALGQPLQQPLQPTPQQQQQQPGGFFGALAGQNWSPFPTSNPMQPQPPVLPQQPQPPPQQQQQQQQQPQPSADTKELKKAIEEQSSVIREMLASLKDVSTSLKDQAIQRSFENNTSNNGTTSDANLQLILQAIQASGDVKAELSSIKALLVASLASRIAPAAAGSEGSQSAVDLNALLAALTPTPSASSGSPQKKTPQEALMEAVQGKLPASTSVEEAKAAEEDVEEVKKREGITKARDALGALVVACPDNDELLTAGCNMLLMFLRNIIKDPLNPRFRRVARSNSGFKKNLEPLTGHLQFFEAVGFEERGSQQLELKPDWVESLESSADNAWAKAIIQDAITNLESIREQRSLYPSANSPATVAASTDATKPSSASLPAPAVQSSTFPSSLREKWQPPSASSNAQAAKYVQDPIQNPVPPPCTVPARPAASPSPPSTPSAPAQPQQQQEAVPSYPPTFAEIVRMQQEGKRPDGIKDIPDRLSSDEPSKPSLAPVPKPWERNNTMASSATSTSPVQVYPVNTHGYDPTRPKVEIVDISEQDSGENDSNSFHNGHST